MTKPPSPDILSRADLGATLDDPSLGHPLHSHPLHGYPLHGRVRQFLRETIEEHFEDGQTFWTERLLGERLGVARGTVRHALEALTREGVLVRQAKSGSYVRKSALTAVGLIFERANSDFGAEMMQQIAAQCIARGLQLNLYPLQTGTRDLIERVHQPPASQRLLLMAEGHEAARGAFKSLGEQGYRVLSLDDVGADGAAGAAPFVTTDGARAVQMAVEHLRDLGHTRIAFFNNEPALRPSVQRKIAEFERLQQAGGFEGRLFHCESGQQSSFEHAYAALPALWNGDLWGREARPTAIFTASDPGAWAALRWFAERDIAVPGRVSVLGFENVKPDAFTHPPLSTIGHDFEALARRALDLLLAPHAASQWIAPRLVLRQSTALVSL